MLWSVGLPSSGLDRRGGKEPLTSGWSSKTWSPREEPSYRPRRVLLSSALLIQAEDCFQSLKINSKQVTEIWYKKRAILQWSQTGNVSSSLGPAPEVLPEYHTLLRNPQGCLLWLMKSNDKQKKGFLKVFQISALSRTKQTEHFVHLSKLSVYSPSHHCSINMLMFSFIEDD